MREVWCVVPPDLVLLDFAGVADAFRVAVAQGAEFALRYATAADPAASSTSLGVGLTGFVPLPASLPDDALVVVCGASNSVAVLESRGGRALVKWLRAVFPGAQRRLACVCSGALVAARAGLLDGRRCTTHHTLIADLSAMAPAAEVLDSRVFVADGDVYTSAGITAGIDLALYLIAELASPQISVAVARELVVYLRRGPEDPALSPWLEGRNHMDARVHVIQDALLRAPQDDWSLPALARRGHMSVRTLTRRFREATGVSVHDYHARLRVTLARQALEAGVSVEAAAEAAGLGSARQLRRLWRSEFGSTPAASRR